MLTYGKQMKLINTQSASTRVPKVVDAHNGFYLVYSLCSHEL
jgi:hypothetical protein